MYTLNINTREKVFYLVKQYEIPAYFIGIISGKKRDEVSTKQEI